MMNYKQANNHLKKHNAIIMHSPVASLSISFTGGPAIAMIRPDRIVHDTKKAAIELNKYFSLKKSPSNRPKRSRASRKGN